MVKSVAEVKTVSDKEAAMSIARRILKDLESPVSDDQRQMIFGELAEHFCLHCGGKLTGGRCSCRRDD